MNLMMVGNRDGTQTKSVTPSLHVVPLVSACLIFVSMAGCVGTNTSDVEIPVPVLGSEYHYLGSDGSWLNITVSETADRKDALLRQHEALILEIDFKSSDPRVPEFQFQEAVEHNKGLLVQQVALCGSLERGEDFYPVGCRGERSMVYPGVTGIPGGLGSGPFWSASIAPGALNVDLDSPILPDWNLNGIATAQKRTFEGRECLTIDYENPSDHVVWGYPEADAPWGESYDDPYYPAMLLSPLFFTPIHSPLGMCDGIAFPVSFTPELGRHRVMEHDVTFNLDSWKKGAGDATVPTEGKHVWTQTGDRLRKGDWDVRLAIDATDSTRLTPKEAHDQAMLIDEDYARLINAGAFVISNIHTDYYGYPAGQDPTVNQAASRSLIVLHPDGELVSLTLERTIVVVDEVEVPGPITVIGKQLIQIQLPDGFEFGTGSSSEQASTAAALARGPELTKPEAGYINLVSAMTPSVTWAGDYPDAYGNPLMRHEGFTLNTWWEPPGSAQSSVIALFLATFDGPSGAILHFERPRDELPF